MIGVESTRQVFKSNDVLQNAFFYACNEAARDFSRNLPSSAACEPQYVHFTRMSPLKLDAFSELYLHKKMTRTAGGSLFIAINQHSMYEEDAKSILF